MSDKQGPESWVEVWMSPRLYSSVMTASGRFKLAVLAVFIALGIAIGGHMYGRYLATSDIHDRDNTIQQLQGEIQRLEGQITETDGKLVAMQSTLTRFQEAMDALMPTQNTYTLNPDQSLIVADGHLTIGLIGLPMNGHINVNINGKQQVAAAGDVIHAAVGPGLDCQVRVQSFDMFKAVITASCVRANADQKGSSNG
jgi:hypothetical protein